jgi:hypothetical protein
MQDLSSDINLGSESTPPLKEESNNRTFIIAAGILAGVVLLTIACMAIYALVILPRQKAATAAQEATIQAQNLEVAGAMTQTAEAAAWTPTKLPTAIPTATNTLAPSPTATPVMALGGAPSAMPSATPTFAPLASPTALATATALAQTGFADEFGLPGLIIMAVVLVMVILLSRRLRKAPANP